MAKRAASDSMALVPEPKKNRNEIAAYTNKDKALLASVSNITSIQYHSRRTIIYNKLTDHLTYRELPEHPI